MDCNSDSETGGGKDALSKARQAAARFRAMRDQTSATLLAALIDRYGTDWLFLPLRYRIGNKTSLNGQECDFDIPAALEHCRAQMEIHAFDWISRIQLASMSVVPGIAIRIDPSLDVDAYCERDGAESFKICLTLGLYVQLLRYALQAVDLHGFLDVERASKLPGFIEDELGCASAASMEWVCANFPNDECNIQEIQTLVYYAIGWIVAHEISHITRGHFEIFEEYADERAALPLRLNETRISSRHEVEADLGRYCELDADTFATILFTRVVLTIGAVADFFPPERSNDHGWMMRHAGVYTILPIIIMDDARRSLASADGYPDPRVRLFNICETLAHMFFEERNGKGSDYAFAEMALFSVSGIMADAQLFHDHIRGAQVEIDPLFFPKGYAYGALAGVSVLDVLGLLDLEHGEWPYFESAKAELLREHLGVAIDGDKVGMPWEVTVSSYIIDLIGQHFKLTAGELRDAWLDAVEALRTKNEINSFGDSLGDI